MRWLCNRLFVIGGCFVTALALLCIWIPNALDVGSASLVINTMFGIITSIEASLGVGSMAQYQIIQMNRVYEYTSLPEEKEELLPTDKTFRNVRVTLPRGDLGDLRARKVEGLVEIVQGFELVLRQIP